MPCYYSMQWKSLLGYLLTGKGLWGVDWGQWPVPAWHVMSSREGRNTLAQPTLDAFLANEVYEAGKRSGTGRGAEAENCTRLKM